LTLSAGGTGVVNIDFGISSAKTTSFVFNGAAINLGGTTGVTLSTGGGISSITRLI
jgi:hypothetical protein